MGKVALIRNLTGRVTPESFCQLRRFNAAAVVGHPDQVDAALPDFNGDRVRAGVNRVFNQFLDDVHRSFHDFACGDSVDCFAG